MSSSAPHMHVAPSFIPPFNLVGTSAVLCIYAHPHRSPGVFATDEVRETQLPTIGSQGVHHTPHVASAHDANDTAACIVGKQMFFCARSENNVHCLLYK